MSKCISLVQCRIKSWEDHFRNFLDNVKHNGNLTRLHIYRKISKIEIKSIRILVCEVVGTKTANFSFVENFSLRNSLVFRGN